MQMKSPRVNLVINRDEAAALGLSASDIETALYDGFGPQWASTIYGSAGAVQGAARARSADTRSTPTRCGRSRSRRRAGALVPLQSVVTPQETVGPQTVNHVGELPAVSISFGLRPGVSLGAAVDHINRVAAPGCCRRR